MLPDQAQFLYDHLPSNHYDLLAGVSMGGLITFEYYKLLSPDQQPKRMVLLEPSLDLKLPPQIVTKIRESADSPKEEGVIAKENPGWEATDNVVDRLGLVRTNKEVFQQIFQGVRATSSHIPLKNHRSILTNTDRSSSRPSLRLTRCLPKYRDDPPIR